MEANKFEGFCVEVYLALSPFISVLAGFLYISIALGENLEFLSVYPRISYLMKRKGLHFKGSSEGFEQKAMVIQPVGRYY